MRAIFFTALSLVAATSLAELKYTVYPGSAENKLKVELEVVSQGDKVFFQIPNWAPGSYRYDDVWKRVSDVKAEGGVTVKTEGINPLITTWSIPATKGKSVTISYEIPVQYANSTGHFSGPSFYMYPVGRTQEPCQVEFKFAAGTPIITGMNPVRGNQALYKVPTYDVLADNPVTWGDYTLDTYKSFGKTHYIAYRGVPKKDVDRAYVIKACKFVTDMEADFFGKAVPYDRYVWHFSVNDAPDGAGGLEHLSSTEISLASGVGPGAVSVLSHEFFHLWNVKRIRSKILGPFDYTTQPQTGALWWLEGVTDYYAHTLLGRYGWYGKNERHPDPIAKLYADAVQNLSAVRARPARLDVSPYESSYRVRDASNGRGNSQGYQVSYYDTGWLVGMVLDIEMLDQTNGKRSLDDVELALWDQCRDDKPGFEEGDIRRHLVRFGGYLMGTFYDDVVMKPGELPVEQQLAKIGKELMTVDEKFGSIPFSLRVSLEDKAPRVSLSEDAGIPQGSIVTKINGTDVTGDNARAQTGLYRSLQRTVKAGDILKVTLKEGEKTREINVKVSEGTRKVQRIVSVKNPTERQLALRKVFESKKRR
ncbi:MAG: hypothetical protein WCK51_15110 [Armatimonadota bacterium]